MTTLEDQIRQTLHDLADDAAPVHLLSRLDRAERRAPRAVIRRRIAVATVAAAIVAAIAVGSLLALRIDQPSIIEPVQRPPKIFRLSGATSPSPGRVDIAVLLSQDGQNENTPAYLQPAAGGPVVQLPPSDWATGGWAQHMSADGTRLIRMDLYADVQRMEIVNLITGQVDDLGGTRGYCPTLSPDNKTVAYSEVDEPVIALLDVRTGSTTPIATSDTSECGDNGVAWSPDSQQLVVRQETGSLLVDRRGDVIGRLRGAHVTNASMSWSPDGRSILVYRRAVGEYSIVAAAGARQVRLTMPPDGIRPLGWAGSRVVWLVGQPGSYSLVSTDRTGADPQTWMWLDVGERTVESVSWSRALSGTAGKP